jgi:hypothetical protein
MSNILLDTISTISIDTLHSIEKERAETMSKVEFIKWMRELNVSRLYEDPSGKLKAREIMSEYVYKRV